MGKPLGRKHPVTWIDLYGLGMNLDNVAYWKVEFSLGDLVCHVFFVGRQEPQGLMGERARAFLEQIDGKVVREKRTEWKDAKDAAESFLRECGSVTLKD
jgi:hypothetical protein